MLITGYNLHPFLQTLPFPKHDKEVIFANLIKSFHFFKPLLNRDKLSRLRVNKFAYSLAAKSVIVLNLFVYYL